MTEAWNSINHIHPLPKDEKGEIKWVEKNTAILVVHGIGDQLPLETIDSFARGLVKQYKKQFPARISLSHEIISKPGSRGDTWFDNAVRIHLKGSDKFIDVYEYYWANYTQDKATWSDLTQWLQGVVRGARKFYKKNAELGVKYSDSSFFTSNGTFKTWRYNFFIHLVSKTFILLNLITTGLLKLCSFIPVFGELASRLLKSFFDSSVHKFTNVIGDIVVYNVADPKCKFYEVRRQIMDGAVHALQFLIEKNDSNGLTQYPSVVVAGHSLGSQVAYDAINKLDLLVNKDKVSNYDRNGRDKMGNSISTQLHGFITFGSPLDKIAFFLREQVPDELYLRQQLLDNYHGFKQRNWSLNAGGDNGFTSLPQPINRVFEDVKWKNYFDSRDYVSGSLDYYLNLENVDCKFKSNLLSFTHSYYWQNETFYLDIIRSFLK